ncbi:MAG: hypothetical protein QG656_2084, partial [Candidatus Hydrogenedentes bacterium]|nr:hypothetical protein [Candidatus Hydrogenedentota bacterium]
QKRLQAAAQAADPTEELYHAVTSYLADKLNVSEGGMTSADAQRLLQHRGVDPAIEDQFVKILRACERSRYGTGRLSSEEAQALTHAAMTAVDSLDEAIKKRPARRKES